MTFGSNVKKLTYVDKIDELIKLLIQQIYVNKYYALESSTSKNMPLKRYYSILKVMSIKKYG